jgi:two-component system CheB/CheR fusion protein
MLTYGQMAAPDEPSRVPVVGVGVSAGGIAALRTLLQALPSESPLAVVVIQDLTPGQPNHLPDLLRQWTSLTVCGASDGEPPERACIHVAGVDAGLALEGGVFRATALEGGASASASGAIDTFFESLARERGAHAIGVVLSGLGSDGLAGASHIRGAGGVVLVQEPSTAINDRKLRAIIERGSANYVLPVGQIAEQLVRCASPFHVAQTPCVRTGRPTDGLDDIIDLIRQQVGFDLGGYKATPLIWRIQQRLDARRVRSLDDYADLLRDDPAELEGLMRLVPFHVTGFFRDSDAWDVLARDVLERVVGERNGDEPIRVWTPACATGEEAYSVAMLLSEQTGRAGIAREFQVFGTDASSEVVVRAARGVFSERALAGVDPERRARFFYGVDGVHRVKRSLRAHLVFARHDLLADPPFGALDLVTCRNLLIYLEPETVNRVLATLHGALRSGGYLFLGNSESLLRHQRGFEPVSARWHIYRKVGDAAEFRLKTPLRLRGSRQALAVPATAHRAAVEAFDLPSVLTDGEFQMLRVHGDTRGILRIPSGPPTQNLLDLVEPELAMALKGALNKALTVRDSILLGGLRDRQRGDYSLNVRVTPLEADEKCGAPRVLVSFIRAQDRVRTGRTAARARHDLDAPDEGESNESARVSEEELDASREELVALNEELSASNQQLHTANDDLNHANADLERTIAELDLQRRVLGSGAVMTLFLDPELRVRWFTPAVNELFPLTPADIGRPITDIAQKFENESFVGDVRAVMLNGEPREAEVQNAAERCFLRRIRPHLSSEETNDGVAVTFTDITERKRIEEALRQREAWVRGQREALEAALDGEPLQTSLAALVRTAVTWLGEDSRAAFYLSNAAGTTLHHIVGMPLAYAEAVDGFKIGPESLACGLATHSGIPVITPDVTKEPRWVPWLSMAQKFDYRGCWSFPLHTTAGNFVGTLALYFRKPREATPLDLEFAQLVTQTAAIIVARHMDAELRKSAERALRESSERSRAN